MRVLGGLGGLGRVWEGSWAALERPGASWDELAEFPSNFPPVLALPGEPFPALLVIFVDCLGDVFSHTFLCRLQGRFWSDFGTKMGVKMGPKTVVFDALFSMSILKMFLLNFCQNVFRCRCCQHVIFVAECCVFLCFLACTVLEDGFETCCR